MSFMYCTTDLEKWGVGILRLLHDYEVDRNFWHAEVRLSALEARPLPSTFEDFEVIGTNFYIHLTNSAVYGPYELPVAHYRARGLWTTNTNYAVMDTFYINGTLYEVLIPHLSDPDEFDEGATDGSGNNLYSVMLPSVGNSLPTGGAPGQIMYKTSATNYAVSWRWIFPTASGNAGKYLRQASNTQDDVELVTPDASEISFTPATSSTLSDEDDVGGALEALANGTAINIDGIPYTPPSGSSSEATTAKEAIDEALSGGGTIGRQTLYISAGGMTPLMTNGAVPGVIEMSGFVVLKTLDFDPDTSQYAQFEVTMPKSWDKQDLAFQLVWSHETTATNYDVEWRVYAWTVTEAGALDVSSNNRVAVVDTGGTADAKYTSNETDPLTVFDGNTSNPPVDGDLLFIQVERNAGNVTDTLAVNARLQGLRLFYNTTAGTDN